MKRSSEAISLVLIGAAMVLPAGCHYGEEDPEEVAASTGAGGHVGGHFYHTSSHGGGVVVVPSTGGRAGTSAPSVGGTHSGGFGSTGTLVAAGIGG